MSEVVALAPSLRQQPPYKVSVRLADEGVPLRAIARSLQVSVDDIRAYLRDAVSCGILLALPRDDWPPGTRRDEREPNSAPLDYDHDHTLMLCMRTFNFTQSEARIFNTLLRRPEATKAALHLAVQGETATAEEETEIKIVDVYICKIRKKLPEGVRLLTLWGRGYFIPLECKKTAFKAMGVVPGAVPLVGIDETTLAGARGRGAIAA